MMKALKLNLCPEKPGLSTDNISNAEDFLSIGIIFFGFVFKVIAIPNFLFLEIISFLI